FHRTTRASTFYCDGAAGRADAGTADWTAVVRNGEAVAARNPDCGCSGIGAREGDCAPRHQAGQYFPDRPWPGEDFGFWAGQGGEAERGFGGHFACTASGHARRDGRAYVAGFGNGNHHVYVAGAGARRIGGCAYGFVFAGYGAVPDGDWKFTVSGGYVGGDL